LEVLTSLDCVNNLNFLVFDSFTNEILYTIGSGEKETFYPFVLDSISIQTNIANACGPVMCAVKVADVNGQPFANLPSFVTFSHSTMSLRIKTADLSQIGTYPLLFDYFLSYFIDLPDNKHLKKLVKLILVAPLLQTS
jgi:hypothetical protein